jgi:thymidylate synthase (FAD)
MNIIKPSVELIAMTRMLDGRGPQELLEEAGRTCYKSEHLMHEGSAASFVNRICVQRGHESVAEHASATFRIITDRAIANQITRHRLAAYSQESMRYCNYSKTKFGGVTFIEPHGLGAGVSAWKQACEHAEQAYLNMLSDGVKPEQARSVLPLCTKTELVATMNMRSWRHFITLRTSNHAQPDIRDLAYAINNQLAEHVPALFKVAGV